jgi:hypothetical protein
MVIALVTLLGIAVVGMFRRCGAARPTRNAAAVGG